MVSSKFSGKCGKCGKPVKGGHNRTTCGKLKAVRAPVLKGKVNIAVRKDTSLKGEGVRSATGVEVPTSVSDAVGVSQVMMKELAWFTPVRDVFTRSGYELSLVGGSVRDIIMRGDGSGVKDYDFTTNAHPNVVRELLREYAETVWDVGAQFGTIAAKVEGKDVEITTYRADTYREGSRKPEVAFSNFIEDDLVRRDFTMNAVAFNLLNGQIVDPYGGVDDIRKGIIRTPSSPDVSFTDDPLRMLRAARFTSQLGFTVNEDVLVSMRKNAGKLVTISRERVRDEFTKTLLASTPRPGVSLLVDTGVAAQFIPELVNLRMNNIYKGKPRHKDVYTHTLTVLERAIWLEQNHIPTIEPDVSLRLAALLHDVGKPATRKFHHTGAVTFHNHDKVGGKLVRERLQTLRYPNSVIEEVVPLVEMHLRAHGYSPETWTDAGIRRYINDAGPLLHKLNKLTRADATTGIPEKAHQLEKASDMFEAHIRRVQQAEKNAVLKPALNGEQIMTVLKVKPGPVVGAASKHLMELRLDKGILSEAEAERELLLWWENVRSGGDGG